MNEILEKFLTLFNLEKMGHKPFILLESYPTNCYSNIYLTFGKFLGPVLVTFHGDNITFRSAFRPVVVYHKEGPGYIYGNTQILLDRTGASFHIQDIDNFPVYDVGHQISSSWKRCRMFVGKKEVRELLTAMVNQPSHCTNGGRTAGKWEILKQMYEAAIPKLGFLEHDFTLPEKAKADS